jgi:hypothetical protein
MESQPLPTVVPPQKTQPKETAAAKRRQGTKSSVFVEEMAGTALRKQKDGRPKSSQFVCKLSAAPQLRPPDAQCYLKANEPM